LLRAIFALAAISSPCPWSVREEEEGVLFSGDQQDCRWFACSLCCCPVLAIAIAISWSLVPLAARLFAFSDLPPEFSPSQSLPLLSVVRLGDSLFAAGSEHSKSN
jgi:hypothetical protein